MPDMILPPLSTGHAAEPLQHTPHNPLPPPSLTDPWNTTLKVLSAWSVL